MLLSRQDRREAAEGAGYLLIGSIALVAICFIIAAVAWWLNTSTSAVRGRGDLQQQRNSAANIAHWSSVFNGLAQQITADQANIVTAKSAANASGATRQDQIDLEGAVQNGASDVAEYNGDVNNVLAVVPAGLPTSFPISTCGG